MADNKDDQMAEADAAIAQSKSVEICPHCGAHLVSHKDYCDHLTQKNCFASKGSSRVYPDWRESPDGPYD